MSPAERLRAYLAGRGAPRFLDDRLAREAVGGDGGVARLAVAGLVATRVLVPAGEGLYANRLSCSAVHPNEIVPHLCPDAVVGLRTVLGEAGVTDNPSRVVYAVRRAEPDRAPDVGLRFPFAACRLLSMDGAVLGAGDEADRREPGGRYPRATPERALCDWLHLASPRGGRLLDAPGTDLDLSELDRDRLARLAGAMGIADALSAYLARHAEAAPDRGEREHPGPGH